MSTSSTVVLILAVFGASAVEMVEALTIVVAAGVSRGWRSACEGIVGAILLVFGLQWLRKAVLRATGYKAKHDEDAIFAAHVKEMEAQGQRLSGRDSIGFAVAFKGVFLEGLEV